jgi:hypothetical protein
MFRPFARPVLNDRVSARRVACERVGLVDRFVRYTRHHHGVFWRYHGNHRQTVSIIRQTHSVSIPADHGSSVGNGRTGSKIYAPALSPADASGFGPSACRNLDYGVSCVIVLSPGGLDRSAYDPTMKSGHWERGGPANRRTVLNSRRRRLGVRRLAAALLAPS